MGRTVQSAVRQPGHGRHGNNRNNQMSPYIRHTALSGATRGFAYLLTGMLLSSCAHQYVDQLSQVAANTAIHHVPTATGVEQCRDWLAMEKDSTGHELDAANIRLINWNIQKQRNSDSGDDLKELASDKDLILIQEASLREETIAGVDSSKHWSFAPGYRLNGEVTGVMTLSSIKPLTQCSFVSLEPVLRTPKATSITEYGLSSTDETLAVVNMHVVNFSLGLKAFRKQFDQVHRVLESHNGPIILSGDFNTWRKQRLDLVDEFAQALGLVSVSFGEDRRVKVLGNVLDHIYVRGLSAQEAMAPAVESSDHNPMSATLAL